MKNLIATLRISLLATLVLGVLVSIIYPVAVWAVSHVVWRDKANGSLITQDDKVVGSELLGQNFSAPDVFHPRPSAAGKGYDATNSSGSNLGPISGKFLTDIKQRVQTYREINHLATGVLIPADAVTASGSGLDPHISPANAALQAPRVAQARGLAEDQVRALIAAATENPDLGILGEARVNVLKLNLSLDQKP